MDGSAWAAIIVGGLTLIGTVTTVIVGNSSMKKLLAYRIEQLEKKVDKHNSLVERMFRVEGKLNALDELCCEKFKVANHRIEDLEKN